MGSVFRAHFFVSQLAFVSRGDSSSILDLIIDALDWLAIIAVLVIVGFPGSVPQRAVKLFRIGERPIDKSGIAVDDSGII